MGTHVGSPLENLAALHISVKQVERAAEDLGEEIAGNEKSVIENGIPCSRTLYLGIDGTGCPVRKEETEGRKGKQPDGSAKTREVKLAVTFSADSRDKNINSLIIQGRKESESTKRKQIYLKLNNLVLKRALFIPLFQDTNLIIVNKRIGPIKKNAFGRIDLYSIGNR